MNHTVSFRDYSGRFNLGPLLRNSLFQEPVLRAPVLKDLDRWLREAQGATENNVSPALHTEDGANGYELTTALPGLTDKDVELTIDKGVLTLNAVRKVSVPEGERLTHRERPNLKVSRSIQLPEDVDAGAVEASLRDGLLRIRLPKRPSTEPRKILVTG